MNVITAPVMLGSVAAMIMITYSQAIATTYTFSLAFYRIASKSCMLRSICCNASLSAAEKLLRKCSEGNAAEKSICVDISAVSNEYQRLIIFA